MPPPARERGARIPLLHPEPGRSHRRDLPHARRAREEAGRRCRLISLWRIFSITSPIASCCATARWEPRCRRAISTSSATFSVIENCTEIVCESRPDLVREIHRGYLEAGCDAIQTNSFGGSPITLGEFGLADRAFALNRLAAELAREAIAEFAHDGRTRFVLGSVGPGTRLPSLGHIAYQPLEDALAIAMRRADRRRGRRDHHRDLPGPAADQGRGQRRQAGARRRGQGHPDPRPGHGRDHRHIAGRRRHRRRGDDHRRARRADDRAQLRHRPARDGRARQMARRELARADLGAAQCRAARAGRRPAPITRSGPPSSRNGSSASCSKTGST